MDVKVISTGSGANTYLTQHNADMLLLDAGVKYEDILKATNYEVSKINGALITHHHL